MTLKVRMFGKFVEARTVFEFTQVSDLLLMLCSELLFA
jgi:hypothetical protein